jgi:hypothetical protein
VAEQGIRSTHFEKTKVPRENVPHRVDEIADAILEKLKKSTKKKLSKEKMYDLAYGTAWKAYYRENPSSKKKKEKKSNNTIENLKIAQFLDGLQLFDLADSFDLSQ